MEFYDFRTATASGNDAGLRLRDADGDGECEVVIANETVHQLLHRDKASQQLLIIDLSTTFCNWIRCITSEDGEAAQLVRMLCQMLCR